jgi:serine/threonine protein kinase
MNLGRFEIVERLGSGGMGVLYKANDPQLHRPVAIKVLSADIFADDQSRARFFREAQAAARVQHRHIVTIYEFGEDSGIPFIVMEFLKGQDLSARMLASPPLSLDQKLNIASQLCVGLSAAHVANIVHRDVKPPNVWIEGDGNVKLLDFGIAKLASTTLTRPADFAGSACYMSPEQLSNKPVDHRADIFSVGVMLYELLSGHKPFLADSPAAVMLKIVSEDPQPLDRLVPDLPPRLVAAVGRALNRDPEKRFQSALEFEHELQQVRSISSSISSAGPKDFVSKLYVERPLALIDAASGAADPTAARNKVIASLIAGALMSAFIVVALGSSNRVVRWTRRVTGGPSIQTERPTIAPPAAEVRSTISVSSDPSGAAIRLDGTDTGLKTPSEVAVSTTSPTVIELVRPGFEVQRHSVDEKVVASGRLDATLTRAPIAFVANGAYPFQISDGPDIISKAKLLHQLTIIPPKTLRFRAPEYFLDQTVNIDSSDGARVVRDAPALGKLRVLTSMSLNRCQLSIDRQQLGFPPIVDHQMVIGTHIVNATCPGGQMRRETVSIRAGQLSTVIIR